MKEKALKLKRWGCYEITRKGVWFHTENGFKVFVPKKIMDSLNGMVV